MIARSLLTTFIILVLYQLTLPHLSHRFFSLSGQQRANYMRAQRYLYDAADDVNVIIGSSMSLALNDKLLGPRFFNLALPGNNIFTTLEVIRRAGKHPNVLLIEANSIEASADAEFIGELLTPWLREPRRYFSMFREEGRPANFAVGIMNSAVSRLDKAITSQPRSQGEHGPLSADVFTKVVNVNAQGYRRVIAADHLHQQADRLAEIADRLTKTGIVCVFYEMPVDKALVNLSVPTANREAVQARFPKDKYHWLTFDRDHNYETVDGIHLTSGEANRVTSAMLQQLNQIVGETTTGIAQLNRPE